MESATIRTIGAVALMVFSSAGVTAVTQDMPACDVPIIGDLIVSGSRCAITSDVRIRGNVWVENGGELVIKGTQDWPTEVVMDLAYDEEFHIDVSDTARLVVDNGIIRTDGDYQYWIEMTDTAELVVSGESSWITFHSGIRPHDHSRIEVTGGDVEELQVRDQVTVVLTRAATYPVFFFDGVTARLSGLYTDTGFGITNDIVVPGGWSFRMTDAWVEGYQIDLMHGADVTLDDSDGIVLSIHTPGTLGDDLQIVEGLTSDGRADGATAALGSTFRFTDSNIALINVYVFGSDRVLLRDLHVNEVNAEQQSLLVIGQKGFTTTLNCNLCQVYDDATFIAVDVTIDDRENVPSATSSYASSTPTGRGTMRFVDSDLTALYLTTREEGQLELWNSPHDPLKLNRVDESSEFRELPLGADFTAVRRLGSPPLDVQFIDLSGGGTTRRWEFGDGVTSTERHPLHRYRAPGRYDVRQEVEAPGASAHAAKPEFIEVTGTSPPACEGNPVFVTAAAHARGIGDAQWRTDLSVFNWSGEPLPLGLAFLQKDRANDDQGCLNLGTLAPDEGRFFEDIVLSVFGHSSGVGGIAVYTADIDSLVTSRTFNTSPQGTFGQAIPGRSADHALVSGDTGVLIQLHDNDDFRTNVGVLNVSAQTVTVTIDLYDGRGSSLVPVVFDILPYSLHQVDRIFSRSGAPSVTNGRAEVSVDRGAVLAYASVVDNQTSDPSYLEAQ